MRFFIAILLLCSGLSFSPVANGQAYGTLRGVITDAVSNQSIAFAGVLLTSVETGVKDTLRTDIDGKFEIEAIDTGFYLLEVSYVGYPDFKQDNVQIKPGTTSTIRLKLPDDQTNRRPFVSYEYAKVDRKGSRKQIERRFRRKNLQTRNRPASSPNNSATPQFQIDQ